MSASLAAVHRFLVELERCHEPTLAAIREHRFVTDIREGKVPAEGLRRFAVAEYWYMRGGVKHFALSVLNAPDLETQRFFHERLSGELEYLHRFGAFIEALGLSEQEVEQEVPPSQALNAVNYLFRLSVEAGPAEKGVAWFLVGRVFADTCEAMRIGLTTHYRIPEEAVEFFSIPHVRSQRFVDGIARLISLYGAGGSQQTGLEQVAARILAYEKDFYDSLASVPLLK
jgi:thiaminase